MTSNTGPQLHIDLDFPNSDVDLDIDAILTRGHARVRRRRLAAIGVVAVAALLVGAGATLAHAPPRHGSPATTAAASGNLMAEHPPEGHVEVLRTGAGWHPVAYRDRGGRLCEGWLDPVSHGVTGSCVAPAVADGRVTAVTRPLLIEPQAGVSGGSVQAFGVAGPATHTLDLATSDTKRPVQLSTVRSKGGDRAWLTSFAVHRASHRTVHLVAHDRRGRVIATVGFHPPAGGSTPVPTSPASPQPATPSASPVSATPTATDDSTPEPTPTEPPESPEATPRESPAVTESPLAATTP